MKTTIKKHHYIPSTYEASCDFNFDFHLDFADYCFVFFYLVLVGPLLLLGWLIALPIALFSGKKQLEMRKGSAQIADNRISVFISKFF